MQEVKPLLVFATLLEEKTMSAAAARLGMTASAVSQHIGRLERKYGVRLFNRNTRNLTPTDEGRVLAASCARLLDSLDGVSNALADIKGKAAGEVKIALPSGMAGNPVLQCALRRLRQEYPAITLRLNVGDGLLDLQRGTVDIALRGGEHALDNPNLVARHLARWPYRICASPGYLADHPVASPDDLSSLYWLYAHDSRIAMRRGTEHFVLSVGAGMYCSQLAALVQLAAAGLGAAVLVEGDMAAELAADRLRVVLPDWTLPSVDVYAVTPYRIQSAKIQAVMSVLLDTFGMPGCGGGKEGDGV
ncbi:MAG: LysR family transcriptional regulator [Neisseria sp.]|nr:LysR family transcriptional regulator [Neisseria sp.]